MGKGVREKLIMQGTRKLNLKMIINILRSKGVPQRLREKLWKFKM